MRKSKCDSCSNPRYCLQRDTVTQCLACALGDLSDLLRNIAVDLRALKEAVPRDIGAKGGASPRRCVICRKDAAALGLPRWEGMCALCIAEALGGLLEFIRAELKTIMQTCARCGQQAQYLWAGWMPLCEYCAVLAWLTVLQELKPGGEPDTAHGPLTSGELSAGLQA